MDEKSRLSFRNWDFAEHTVGVPFRSSANEHQASFLRMNMYSDSSMIPEAEEEGSGMEFDNHVWVHQRNFFSETKVNSDSLESTQINTETGLPPAPISMYMPTTRPSKNEELGTKSSKIRKPSSSKKSNGVKPFKVKIPKKRSDTSTKKKRDSVSNATQKRSLDVVIDGTTIDFSQVPAPVCSCTGVYRQCYRWGAGGWQSSCCTTSISEYPLPLSSSRPGARLAGRKMSNGAYAKLLQRLAAEGYVFSDAVDLKDHWAKHDCNKDNAEQVQNDGARSRSSSAKLLKQRDTTRTKFTHGAYINFVVPPTSRITFGKGKGQFEKKIAAAIKVLQRLFYGSAPAAMRQCERHY
ncbi:hypothetical protein IFM89_020439 [Coptis chinensis]|uniref:GAGA-binding transcriptional activator n=1 Tax=Coptis chinensis TaxID=261450 RepID=A0A835IU76_9MAGN|nr:hypothetical protein IFM89_020439 [Coptis chinensis]